MEDLGNLSCTSRIMKMNHTWPESCLDVAWPAPEQMLWHDADVSPYAQWYKTAAAWTSREDDMLDAISGSKFPSHSQSVTVTAPSGTVTGKSLDKP